MIGRFQIEWHLPGDFSSEQYLISWFMCMIDNIYVFLIFDFWQWYSACLNIWWKELMWSQILQCVLWELLWPYISIWHKDRKIIPQGNSIHTLGVSIPSMSSSHWKGKSLEKTSFFELLYMYHSIHALISFKTYDFSLNST